MRVLRPSFYINSHGPDVDAVRQGFAWLTRAASAGTGLLAVNGLGNLEGTITSFTGEAFVKTLKKDKKVKLPGGPVISLLTERERLYSWPCPVLAIYATPKLLDKIDGISGVTGVLAIPWVPGELNDWVKTWSARELGDDPAGRTNTHHLDPVVEVALASLTRGVNVSTGLSHPLDRPKAVWLFRILRDGGVPFDPEAVKGWLLSRGGWTPKGANDVRQIAADVLGGKCLQVGERPWAKDILQQWRATAEQSE